jgi:hypothetical protein
MSTQLYRGALLAGVLLVALSPPALAADVDVASPPPGASDEAQLALLSPTAQQGPIIARESLATETKASTSILSASQPTRSASNLSQYKRARAASAGGSYAHRPTAPPLILGVRF